MLDLSAVDNRWAIFLDRDGVINHDLSPYTLNAAQFEFYSGVPEAIKKLGTIFNHVFVVTNQRGVGRQLMTENDLTGIHDKMLKGIAKAGGKIDAIYYCTAINDDHPDRKPNPGMALKAIREHPDVVPSNSIIVGNNISDMQFGRNAGLHTVLLHTTGTRVTLPHPLVDLQFNTLKDFVQALINESR